MISIIDCSHLCVTLVSLDRLGELMAVGKK